MPGPITDDTLKNTDSLELIKGILGDHETYFGQFILCLKNLNQAFQDQKEFLEKLQIAEKEKKELLEVFQKIKQMFENNNEPNSVKLGLKIFEGSTHTVLHCKLLAIRENYPALLSGANIKLENAMNLLRDIDDCISSSNKTQHYYHPDITFIYDNFKRINDLVYSKISHFQTLEHWKNFREKLNEGIVQIQNINKVINAIATRSCELLLHFLFSSAQTQKGIEGSKPDCKILAEKLMQDPKLGKIAGLISKKLSLADTLQSISNSFESAQTQAKLLDNFHENVLRVAYLDQTFSLKVHHTLGFCGGDILAWSPTPVKSPIKKKAVFNHCLELHEQDADTDTLRMQLNQISDNQRQAHNLMTSKVKSHLSTLPLFSDESTTLEDASKFASLQKFIADLLNSAKESFEKNDYRGTIEILLTKKGNPISHALGLKILNQGGILHIYFRDINCGEFFCKDFQLFQSWFAYYFCVSNSHKHYDGFTLCHLTPKADVQHTTSLIQKAPETAANPKLEKKEAKESDEDFRNQIINLLPLTQNETQYQEIGLKILELYQKIKEKTEQDHFIAVMFYINVSESYMEASKEREQLCLKAVEVYRILVKINLKHSYNPMALCNMAEFYLMNLKLNQVSKGIAFLKEACSDLAKIDSEENPELIIKLKALVTALLEHIAKPAYPQHYVHLIEKLKTLTKFLEDNEDKLLPEHIKEMINNTFYHHVEELEFGENENPEEVEDSEQPKELERNEDATETQTAEGSSPGPTLHFQYQAGNPSSPVLNGMTGSVNGATEPASTANTHAVPFSENANIETSNPKPDKADSKHLQAKR